MTGLELPALKTPGGIAFVAYSLYQKSGNVNDAFDSGKAYEAVLGQAIGGIVYDVFKSGGAATWETLKAKYNAVDLSTDGLNHDLQKAARKAQLIATFFAAQHCLASLKNNERSKIGKIIDKVRPISSEETFFVELIKYLDNQMRDDEIKKTIYRGNLNAAQFEAVFKIHEQSAADDSQTKIIKSLREDVFNEIELVTKTFSSFKFDHTAFSLLKKTIENGWDDIVEQEKETKFVSLEIFKYQKKLEHYDWFELICAFFNEEYKNNPRVQAAADKQLILDISAKLDSFGTLNTSLNELTGKISAFSSQLDRIEDKVDEILEVVKKIVAPEKEGEPLNLVSLPDRTDKIYGRSKEIEIILDFLRSDAKHGAIVSPTCFGKTSLIKKFLYLTTEGISVKPEYEPLFDKVIYLYCYKNQVFQQIVKPFASLEGELLTYVEGDEANFLKQDVFDKLQNEKVLLVLDNFESWLTNDEKYLNDEIRVFLNTLFNSDHRIRTIFVSQMLPHGEREFFNKVEEIKGIEKKLEKGLDEASALELVRNEGRPDVFKNVTDAELKEFFGKVFYIPQAIQSMIDFVDEEAISFDEFQTEFWEEFQAAEADESRINDDTPTELRPTRALLKRQILKSDEARQYLLSLLAFFESNVPKELLVNEASGLDVRDLRKALDRLVKNKLVLTETDAQQEMNDKTGKPTDIIYYSLHGLVREIVSRVLPLFEEKHPIVIETLADRMEGEARSVWEKRLFEKLLAFTECWEKLEYCLFIKMHRAEREFQMDLVGFRKALALQTSTANHKLSREQIAERAKNSEIIYLKFINKYPNDAEAFNNLGNLLTNAGRIEEAEEKYEKAIELNPNYAEAFNNFGNLLANTGRIEEAEEKYHRAIELNPNYAAAYYNLGNLLKIVGRVEEAEKKYEKAIELNPSDFSAYYNFGNLLKDIGKIEEAEEKYNKAIELNPNDFAVYINLGNLLKDIGKIEEAEEKYNKAIELNPNYAEAYGNVAVLKAQNDGEKAKDEIIEYLGKCVELNPAHKDWAKGFGEYDFIRDDPRFLEIVDGDD